MTRTDDRQIRLDVPGNHRDVHQNDRQNRRDARRADHRNLSADRRNPDVCRTRADRPDHHGHLPAADRHGGTWFAHRLDHS